MLDIKLIRANPEIVKRAMKNRGIEINIDNLLKIDEKYRKALQEVERLKHSRNKITDEIRELKKAGKSAVAKIKEAKEIPRKIAKLDVEINALKEKLFNMLATIPNVPHSSVPVGADERYNREVKRWGKPQKFDFAPKPHWEIGRELDILDLERSAKLAGAGFYVFKGLGAKLERALINFMLDFHIKDGFKEFWLPVLVNEKTMFGTAQLPKFADQLYKTSEGLYMIPTAEVPLTNMHANEILDEKDLPKHYCAYTPCFRTERGHHGTETRGIFRLHQFDKVEMVVICHPDKSYDELEMMRQRAEKILEMLGIPYMTKILCTGDMGFASAKTYDIEVWSPAQNKFLEVSSCSNCENFQARRMNTRFRTAEGNVFVHTLNGSGLALPRLMIAILENFQQKDGSVKIPKVLQPYIGGITAIEKKD